MSWRRCLLLLDGMAARLLVWLRAVPHLEMWGVIFAMVVALALAALGYHEHQMPWMPGPGEEVPRGWQAPGVWTLHYYRFTPYLKVEVIILTAVFLLAILRSRGDLSRLVWPAWIVCSLLAMWLGAADFHEQWERVHGSVTGRPFPVGACALKVLLVVLGVFSPVVALMHYQRSLLWQRYVLRLFAQPLVFCLLAFCALRLLSDFIDSIHDFQESEVPTLRILSFYVDLAPAVFVQSVAPALLLATLHSLLKLVRGNELVSLLCCGLSLRSVLRPLLVCSALLCFVSMVVNYDSAQQAEANRQAMMRAFQSKQQSSIMATGVAHYHESTRRLWFVSYVPASLREGKFRGVQVRQMDEKGRLQQSWTSSAIVWVGNGAWSFQAGVMVSYSNGAKVGEHVFNGEDGNPRSLLVQGWSETPWDIMSATMSPDVMGVPDLAGYLQSHSSDRDHRALAHAMTELWHRFAMPWQGLPLVLAVAAIIPIHSRRGIARSVGIGILMYLGLMFLNSATMNLARGGHVPPGISLWIPHVLLTVIGLVMLWIRSGELWQRDMRNRWRNLRGRRTGSRRLPGDLLEDRPDLWIPP